MQQAQLGDAAAYDALLRAVLPWLRAFYARRLPPSLIEDAVQETMIALHSRRHVYAPGRPFRPWLAAIARYKWIDRLRALKRDPQMSLDEDPDAAPAVEGHGDAVVSAVVLSALLSQLKPAQREAIVLVKLKGFSVEEAAARTGQSPSLIKVNVHRGLRKLTALAAQDEG
jgi:RNA polymerase sigma-70 factor (ECF subfamily)